VEEKMTIFLATELTQGESHPMEDERIETRWFTKKELRDADSQVEQNPRCEDDDRISVLDAAVSVHADCRKREKLGRKENRGRAACPSVDYFFFTAFFAAFFLQLLHAAFFGAAFFTAFFVAIVVILPFSHYETKRGKIHHKS
jgi:hypothetical protein